MTGRRLYPTTVDPGWGFPVLDVGQTGCNRGGAFEFTWLSG